MAEAACGVGAGRLPLALSIPTRRRLSRGRRDRRRVEASTSTGARVVLELCARLARPRGCTRRTLTRKAPRADCSAPWTAASPSRPPSRIPTARPHIGHAYELIATDAIARFKRLDGYRVQFLHRHRRARAVRWWRRRRRRASPSPSSPTGQAEVPWAMAEGLVTVSHTTHLTRETRQSAPPHLPGDGRGRGDSYPRPVRAAGTPSGRLVARERAHHRGGTACARAPTSPPSLLDGRSRALLSSAFRLRGQAVSPLRGEP